MLKVKNIDHVAIAVSDLTPAAADLGRIFGLSAGTRETVTAQQTEVVFLHTDGGEITQRAGGGPTAHASQTSIELICPSGNAGLERFLEKRGPGLHHVCFEVDDLTASLAALKLAGVALIDETPRMGARGHLVAFIHPTATGGVLFELCQKIQGDTA